MDAERWSRIQELFHLAAELPPAEQAVLLDAECGDDHDLHDEVSALLDEDARGASLLDRDVAHVANEVLGRGASHQLPDTFGPYRITRLLGEGGMGVVYLARRDDLGSDAAIKILRDAWLSPARRERFAIEQRTLAQLNHPLIARLYDADTLPDGTPWFVMEYVDGVPLTDYCRDHASSMADRLRLFHSVCEAVQHAHGHAIIHRDLKPSNIFVMQDGTVKLLDFGIAKQLDEGGANADHTRTGLRLMTPAYAAPEQIRAGRVGIHTDIYSLGVVLYELLTDRLPFDVAHCTPAEVETLIAEHDPVKPSAVARRRREHEGPGARLPAASKSEWDDLDVMCLTAMHKDPARRYATVDALIRDIDRYLGGQPLEARPDSVRYRTGKFLRRNWRAVSVAAAMFVIVVGLVVFYTVRLTNARNAALGEASRAQRVQGFMVSLFQGGDDDVGPADSLRVVTMLDRGLKEARALDAVPQSQAELYETLGSIYQELGNYGRADSLLRTALAERRALFHGDHQDIANSLLTLGLLLDAQAQYDSAEQLIRQALAMQQRILPRGDPSIAKTTASLGRVFDDQGRYPEAIATLGQAVDLLSAPGSLPADLAATITELANTHFYAGHYAISDSLNQRALAMDRSLYGPRHPNVADDLINLGAIQYEYGHFFAAERYYREALGIIRAWYGSNNPETASALTMLGRTLVDEKKYDEASQLLAEALDIQQRTYGPVHPRVASALNELGKVAQQRGHLDEAAQDFRRMADIYKQVYHDKHYLIGIALSNLATVYTEKKQFGMADSLFRDVIRRYAEVLAPDHQLVGIAHVRLGHTLMLERRYADAEKELTTGYGIIKAQQNPPASWFNLARTDLAAVYDTLKEPGKAVPFRAELAQAKKASDTVAPR
jgi:serine/threonine-protein kinase